MSYPCGVESQSQIKRTLSRPDGILQVRQILDTPGTLLRTALADKVCQQFGFVDARGLTQSGTCLKALRDLEREGHFVLPASATGEHRKLTPRRLAAPVPAAAGVPATVDEVRGLDLILVETEQDLRLWNELMIQEHPRKAGPMVGRQLRYLIGSDHGWLGGVGFGASALQLRDRDRWIGWDREMRLAQLHRVVGLSRLLIRTDVHCQNLASCVLGVCLVRLPDDFEARYGFRPWLVETFVEPEHLGTCFRAANWQRIGQTRGRGRQDRAGAMGESVKQIYVYPLEDSFRALMGVPPNDRGRPLAFDAQIEADRWAEAEFGEAPLGDKRLTERLVSSATTAANHPGQAFCGAAKGDWPAVKGYYRLIDAPDDSAVTMENILLSHRERTVQRMKAQKTVLCIQDGTDLNYSGLSQCEGLGTIGTNQTGASSRGLHLHSTLATTTDGIPLGVLMAQCVAPEPRSKEDDRPSSAIPIEEKKTFNWIVGLRNCVTLGGEMPDTQLISVMDREADFFELFDEQRRNPSVELLVRAKHDRTTADCTNLFDAIRSTPVRSQLRIQVQRQSARPKKSKQKARPGHPKRTADVALRYESVELRPPAHLGDHAPVKLWIIHVVEEHPPDGVEPLEWFLLTTMKIETVKQAETCLLWYCLRWRIEDWHRVLKTGCRIEALAHDSAERLRRAIAIKLVIAWRIMLMTLLGREQPELPAEVLFTDLEIEVLGAFARKKKKRVNPLTLLGDAVRLVAQIGGYLGRANDPPPGHQLMWQGYSQLQLMCEGYALRGGEDQCVNVQ